MTQTNLCGNNYFGRVSERKDKQCSHRMSALLSEYKGYKQRQGKKECVENFQNGNKLVSNNLFFRSHAEHLTSLELGEFSVGD